VVTGAFGSGGAVFGAGEPNATTLTSVGQHDVFLARYAPDGSLAWARSAGGMDYDQGWGVAMLADGSCVMTGFFASSGAVFGAGEPNETTLTSLGQNDVFLARYASDGSLAWARSAGGVGSDVSAGVAVLADGSCVVTGRMASGGAVFGAGEPNETTLTSLGFDDAFLARYAPDGNLAWARSAGGAGGDWGQSVAALADGSCVVAGTVTQIAVFGAGEPNETLLRAAGDYDVFLARYEADGTLAWVRHDGGAAGSRAFVGGLAAGADGSYVMTGNFVGVMIFGEGGPNAEGLFAVGNQDVFVARFSADGGF